MGDKITGIHPDQREAANRVMVLLGDDRHRQALGVNKFIPNTPYLYRMSDRHKIFQPLIQALSKTTQYGHFNIEPESKTEPDPDTKSNTIPVIVASKKNPIAQPPNRQGSKLSYALKSKKEINAARIASAKRRGTYYKKPTRKTHDYKHLQIILDRKGMMKLVTEYSKTEDCQFVLSKSKTARERWMKAFKYIYDNWAEWEAYRENPNNRHAGQS